MRDCRAAIWGSGRKQLVDLVIKNLDEGVGHRLGEQASAAGVSLQRYVHGELTRIASRLSPSELAGGLQPMSRAEFESMRQRLRGQGR